jgi:hypothetical protein
LSVERLGQAVGEFRDGVGRQRARLVGEVGVRQPMASPLVPDHLVAGHLAAGHVPTDQVVAGHGSSGSVVTVATTSRQLARSSASRRRAGG